MSDLTYREEKFLEEYFGMSSGYVLDFSNQSFREFIDKTVNIDIYDNNKYKSGSKAKRLRKFWKDEPNNIVGILIFSLVDYQDNQDIARRTAYNSARNNDTKLKEECLKIAARLKENSPVEHINAIKSLSDDSDDRDFSVLADSIRELVQKNQPEAALDRLHTFLIKYVRALCDCHGVAWDKKKPLHSMFGEYIKKLEEKNAIQSLMSERILKTTISIFDAFNDVRNNQSFAHDNPILNYDESIFILYSVLNTIIFLEAVEKKYGEKQNGVEIDYDNLPF